MIINAPIIGFREAQIDIRAGAWMMLGIGIAGLIYLAVIGIMLYRIKWRPESRYADYHREVRREYVKTVVLYVVLALVGGTVLVAT